ncbi:hypothetical protein NQZ68_031787 [Dissostichus eleginoides]|nr:hypothetical protein NQZ68_031787 [Dissostichus eleginoides]
MATVAATDGDLIAPPTTKPSQQPSWDPGVNTEAISDISTGRVALQPGSKFVWLSQASCTFCLSPSSPDPTTQMEKLRCSLELNLQQKRIRFPPGCLSAETSAPPNNLHVLFYDNRLVAKTDRVHQPWGITVWHRDPPAACVNHQVCFPGRSPEHWVKDRCCVSFKDVFAGWMLSDRDCSLETILWWIEGLFILPPPPCCTNINPDVIA